MATLRTVAEFILPLDADLARRINALLWAYERAALRSGVLEKPLERRHEDRGVGAGQLDRSPGTEDRRVSPGCEQEVVD